MRLRAGTSGFSYKEWKGSFYPEDLPNERMLEFYSQQLDAVEVNNTFYRMPRSAVMQAWAEEVGEGFTFVIKASQRITHRARLKETEETVGYLHRAVRHLGEHLGPVLFQLPPNFHADAERLRDFLASLPDELRAVLEFRHESWWCDEVFAVMEEAGACLCVADDDGDREPELRATAPFGYLRLRREDYEPADLDLWVERLRAQPWEEAFVFFKHEAAGAAARLARDLAERFRSAG